MCRVVEADASSFFCQLCCCWNALQTFGYIYPYNAVVLKPCNWPSPILKPHNTVLRNLKPELHTRAPETDATPLIPSIVYCEVHTLSFGLLTARSFSPQAQIQVHASILPGCCHIHTGIFHFIYTLSRRPLCCVDLWFVFGLPPSIHLPYHFFERHM